MKVKINAKDEELSKKKIIILSLVLALLPLISLPTIFFIASFVIIKLAYNLKDKEYLKLILLTIIPLIIMLFLYYLFNLHPSKLQMLKYFPTYWDECFVGFGIMLSARTSTQEDYAQISLPFSMPMMFVSGVFYPIETMPWILQKLAYVFPLTYLNDAMRGIMLKGQTLGDVWLDLVVLLGFTILFFIIGVKRFNRDV